MTKLFLFCTEVIAANVWPEAILIYLSAHKSASPLTEPYVPNYSINREPLFWVIHAHVMSVK